MSTIKQIRVVPPKPKKEKIIDDDTAEFLPRKFFSLMVVGKRMSGKTSLLCYCLLHPEGWLKNYKETIIFSPTVSTDAQWSALHGMDNVFSSESVTGDQLEAILQRQKGLFKKSKKNTLLIILDDLSSTIKNKKSGLEKALNKYWTTCRHYGVSIVLSAQTLSHLSTTVRGNCTNVWAFRVPLRESRMLAEENSSLKLGEREFIQALNAYTSEPYSFFNCDWQTKDVDMIYGPGFRIREDD